MADGVPLHWTVMKAEAEKWRGGGKKNGEVEIAYYFSTQGRSTTLVILAAAAPPPPIKLSIVEGTNFTQRRRFLYVITTSDE